MSDDEEENFCYFGKPLDPYDEDAFPKKRPVTVEEQIATDAQGRRRFHGAFTGGFSAGFFNTVGSSEGWTPSEFISTRQDKAKNVVQKPEDFMDQEDLGEYGIAPQTVRATKDYSTSKKRRKQVFSEGPIPGTPVLETLFTSGNDTIGLLLLRKIGIKDKIKRREEELDPNTKSYGCQMPERFKVPEKIEKKQYKIPEIYTKHLQTPKSNTFGLDYKGLDRSHVNLFAPSNLVVRDKNNKKFSIAGQAFGVGAFEEDDDDIYAKEDMSNYDFEMSKEKSSKKSANLEVKLLFGMFKPSKTPLIFKKMYPPPLIPHSFTGKHKVKKSRFEQIEVKTEEAETSRSQINPAIRARYLGEETRETYTASKQETLTPKEDTKIKEKPNIRSFDISALMEDKFVSASQNENVNNILEPVKKSETLHGTKDMREAAKMKMFGPLTRVTSDWKPCALLCKRFNVPEPLVELFGLGLWLPELFIKFERYQTLHPNATITVKELSTLPMVTSESCEPSFDQSVIIRTVATGLTALIFNIFSCLIATRVSSKNMTLVLSLVAGLSAGSIYWLSSSFQNLLVACIFQAMIQTANMSITSIAVELFPTDVGGVAVCLVLCVGRVGAAISNVVFAYFMDKHCEVPIFVVAAVEIFGGVICLMVPKAHKRKDSNQDMKEKPNNFEISMVSDKISEF